MSTLHKTEKCIECKAPAEFIRCTQFAGEHPYCKYHAELEEDFMRDDDSTYWVNVESIKE
jgi:hypothetical protein